VRVVLCIDRQQLCSIAFKKRSEGFNRASNRSPKISKSFQKTSIHFLESTLINGLQANGTKKTMMVRLTGLGCRRRLVHRPSVFVSGSSGLIEQVKGWRRFMVADGVLVGRVGAVSARPQGPRSLVAPEGESRRPRIPGFMSPGTEDPRKDRPIDPMCGKNYVRLKRARSRFEPNGQADGRQPFMPASVSRRLSLSLIPSVAPVRGGLRPLFVGRVENAFHPAKNYHRMIPFCCKENVAKKFPQKGGAGTRAYHADGQGLPLPGAYRL
jgi:hypothetical protein